MTLAEIKWAELGELVWVAPLTAVFVSAAYGLLVLGVSRATEAGRAKATGAVAVYGVLAFVAGAVFVGAVAAGIWIIAR